MCCFYKPYPCTGSSWATSALQPIGQTPSRLSGSGRPVWHLATSFGLRRICSSIGRTGTSQLRDTSALLWDRQGGKKNHQCNFCFFFRVQAHSRNPTHWTQKCRIQESFVGTCAQKTLMRIQPQRNKTKLLGLNLSDGCLRQCCDAMSCGSGVAVLSVISQQSAVSSQFIHDHPSVDGCGTCVWILAEGKKKQWRCKKN